MFKINLIIFLYLTFKIINPIDVEPELIQNEFENVYRSLISTEKAINLKLKDKKKSSDYLFPLSFGLSEKAFDIQKKSLVQLNVYKNLSIKLGTKKLNGKIPKKFCPFEQVLCNSASLYRTLDGSCNNLENTWYGMANSPYRRILPPEYDDSINLPRTKSVIENQSLPNARLIALFVHQPNITDSKITNLFLFFGQALDHDITSIASAIGSDGFPLTCNCNSKDPMCFNIPVPVEDFFNRDQTCFNFPRSGASISSFECNLGFREQLNTVTHHIDLSFLYGSDIQTSKETRAFVRGFLLAIRIRGVKHDILPFRSRPFCRGLGRINRCFITGDARAESNAFLTSLQQVYLRQHNIIARELSLINTNWNDEKLFQETRKIMIGIHQHIIYKQWLPILLGKEIYEKSKLSPLNESYFLDYDKNLESYLFNEMGTAVFRFGHMLVKHHMHKASPNFTFFDKASTNNFLFTSSTFFQNGTETQEDYIRGLIGEDCYSPSPAINPDLNNLLFDGIQSSNTKRFSLPALNIQRGRDHGLPGYNKYRKFCGLPVAQKFEDFTNIPTDFINRFKEFYKHPDDVDLWTGGISETPVNGGIVGETFSCLLVLQFNDLKVGDRFYYENGHDPLTRFTIDQLNEIRKFSIERLLCNTASIDSIRENAFLMPEPLKNKQKNCNQFPDLDFKKWKENL